MASRLRLAVAALAFFAGCGRPPLPPPSVLIDEAPAAAPAMSAPSAAPAAGALAPRCAHLAAESEQRLREGLARFRPRPGGPLAPPDADRVKEALGLGEALGFCSATRAGAFAVVVDWLDFNDDGRIVARWGLRFEGQTGRRGFFAPTTGRLGVSPALGAGNCCEGYGFETVDRPVAFDLDGDGIEEIFLHLLQQGNEGHRYEESHLLTARGGAVVAYEPAAPFEGEQSRVQRLFDLRDVDGDGRPDLLLHLSPTEDCAPVSGFCYASEGPASFARTRPDGGFEAPRNLPPGFKP